jgi:DNA excision repair protein ERCC-2
MWQSINEGYTRIISYDEKPNNKISISCECLDPSIISESVISATHSTILMSGTLLPTTMYGEILGFDNNRTIYKEFTNPFPKHNALHWIIKGITTKFNQRTNKQYDKIAKYISEITNNVPGSTVVFFPSYEFRDIISTRLSCNKKIFSEKSSLNKSQKEYFLEKFKKNSKKGAVLLGVSTGSFGEGIDLPGDLLRCVIIVGLPLSKPDAFMNESIRYYDKKFSKGWDYGYIYPAFNRAMQNSGRCIRSKDDRGLIIYMDERYTWNNYKKCFPKDLNIIVTDKISLVKKFFEYD